MLYIVFVIVGFIYVLFDESFWDIAGKAQAAADERNARCLVDLHRAAAIAGAESFAATRDVPAVVRLLVEGVEGSGAFEGMVFSVQLDAEEMVRCERYLRYTNGRLEFRAP